jgi:hypothetical protein
MRFLLTSAGIKNTSIHDALVDLLGRTDCGVQRPLLRHGHFVVGRVKRATGFGQVIGHRPVNTALDERFKAEESNERTSGHRPGASHHRFKRIAAFALRDRRLCGLPPSFQESTLFELLSDQLRSLVASKHG